MKKYLYFILCCSIQLCYSQKLNFIKVNAKSHEKSEVNKKVDNFFENDKESYTSFFYEKPDTKSNKIDRRFILENNKGNSIKLKENEYPIDITNENLYTFFQDFKNHEIEYIVYDLKDMRLSKSSSVKFSSSSSMKVLKDGDIIINEGGHSGDDWASIYSKKMKLKHQFIPFSEESLILSSANEDYIFFASQVEDQPYIRMALYYAFGNKNFLGSQEIEINENWRISEVKTLYNKLAILFSNSKNSSSQILILNSDLKVINKISFEERISHNKIINIGNDIYVNTASSVSGYSADSGKQIWKYDKKKNESKKKGAKFIGTDIFILDKTSILLTESTYDKGEFGIDDLKINVIDLFSKKVIQRINTKKALKGEMKIRNLKKELMFFSKNNILSYEKL